MMTYEEYVAAMQIFEAYRKAFYSHVKEVEAAQNRGEPIESKAIYEPEENFRVSTELILCWSSHYYRVQETKPLTDKDAAVWPRMEVIKEAH